MQARDYIVRHRTEADIAALAAKWRSNARLDDALTFDIARFVQERLIPDLSRVRKTVLRFFDRVSNDEALAYVKFSDPMSMHFDRKVWTLAGFGEPKPRFVVGHEVGHAVLHNDRSMTFSGDLTKHVNIEKERSAEWQADMFASHFLVPDHLLEGFRSEKEAAMVCRVPIDAIRDRLTVLRRSQDSNHPFYEAIRCECGNLTVRRSHDFLSCDSCGRLSEIL